MQDELKPVAWMYEGPAMLDDETIIQDKKCFPLRQAYMPSGWIETPLYAHPPTTKTVDVSETPVGDQQMVEAVDREAASRYYGYDDEKHLTSREHPSRHDQVERLAVAFARHRQAALTAARAQVGVENQRLREALAEIERRTGLLIHQNTGRWSAALEHDRRTVDVLTVNQSIARQALAAGEHRKDAP